jgi:hypothetical protein
MCGPNGPVPLLHKGMEIKMQPNQTVFTRAGGLEYMDNCIKTGECKKP